MRFYSLKIQSFFWLIIFVTAPHLMCQTFTVSGNWAYTIPSTDVTEAGNDFTGIYSSASNQVTMTVFWWFTDFLYRVEVRKDDVDWDSRLQLYIQRTGDGWLWSGWINGGTSYQLITDSNQLFFRGRRTVLGIPIQYQLRNVSVIIPAKTHSTTVVFTFIQE